MEYLRRIIQQLKFWGECKENRLGLWQCPNFLFIVMGLIIVAAMLTSFFIATSLEQEPEIVVFVIIIITSILLIIGQGIIGGFEKMAEVNRMKTAFLSIVSHQLRAPLTSMKWSLGLLTSGRLGEMSAKQRGYLETIGKANHRMVGLINDLLEVNRIEEEGMKPKKDTIRISDLTREVIQELEPIAQSRNMRLEFFADEAIPEIIGDGHKMKIAIQNLVDNAIKFNDSSRGDVKVKIKKKNNDIFWSVRDHGIGISKHDKHRIFDKFFRSRNAIRTKAVGSGLGLFIAKSIIDAHGGKIGFGSKVNKGTTFWFILPVK